VDSLKKPHGILSVKDLVESSFQARFENGRGLQAASAAVLLAEQDPTIPTDLRAAAWTQFGNALRFSGKLRQADAALKKASSFLTPESDPRTRANLLEITASLHRARGHFAESEACLVEAIEIHKSMGDHQAEARDLVLLGISDYDASLFCRASSSYHRALSLLDEESDTLLYVSACHGLIDTLWAAGRLQAAATAFDVAEPVFRVVSEDHLVGKITWLKARIFLALGDKARAAEAFAVAKNHLTDLSDSDLEVLESEMAAAQN
jgi:tetratricopeptide (TPR) repeat protein